MSNLTAYQQYEKQKHEKQYYLDYKTQIEINKEAEIKVLQTYPYRNLATAFRESGKYSEIISYLRLLGLGCVKCKGRVSEPNLALSGYNVQTVLCKPCQTNKPKQ